MKATSANAGVSRLKALCFGSVSVSLAHKLRITYATPLMASQTPRSGQEARPVSDARQGISLGPQVSQLAVF